MTLTLRERQQISRFWSELEAHFAGLHLPLPPVEPVVRIVNRNRPDPYMRESAFRSTGEIEMRSTSNGKTYGSVYGHRAIDAKMRKAWEPLPKEERIYKPRSPVPHVSHDYQCGIHQMFTDDLIEVIRQECGQDVDLSFFNYEETYEDI